MTSKNRPFLFLLLSLVAGLFLVFTALSAPVLAQDADSDGVLDTADNCDASDPSATVVIDGCNTGVDNELVENGCKISDLIEECAVDVIDHGEFVSCVAKLTKDPKKDGIITGKEKGAIQRCAAQADIPPAD